jgi:glutaminase
MVAGKTDAEKWGRILATHEAFAGRKLEVNGPVYESEAATNQRNQAIGALMYAYGLIQDDPKMVTDVYTRQCSINVSARDLATMAATLANGGKNPVTRKQVIKPELVPNILAVMATAGLYDDSGIWLFNVGLPAKSGVGGGLIAVAPGRFGIAAFSPPLDAAGNSVRAQRAIQHVVEALGANPYASSPR